MNDYRRRKINRSLGIPKAETQEKGSAVSGPAKGASKYKGVLWDKVTGSWRAIIKTNGKTKYLGVYTTEEAAARAYDEAALVRS